MNEKKSPSVLESIKMGYETLVYYTGAGIKKCIAKLKSGKLFQRFDSKPAPESVPLQSGDTVPEAVQESSPLLGESDILTAELQDIAQWLTEVKFRTRLFAGVDETDVWKKIGQLNRLYDKALLAERARYDALLQHYRDTMSSQEDIADSEECEVEHEHTEEGEQLDAREDNSEASAEISAEVRLSEPDGEDSADSSGVLADTDSDIPDNSGEGE